MNFAINSAGIKVATRPLLVMLLFLSAIHTVDVLAGDAVNSIERAQQYMNDGRYDDARRVYEKLLQSDEEQPALYNNLAGIYARQGKLEQAKKLLERGIKTDPQYAVMLENLTAVNVAMARQSYSRALELNMGSSMVELSMLDMVMPVTRPGLHSQVIARTETRPVKDGQPEAVSSDQPQPAQPVSASSDELAAVSREQSAVQQTQPDAKVEVVEVTRDSEPAAEVQEKFVASATQQEATQTTPATAPVIEINAAETNAMELSQDRFTAASAMLLQWAAAWSQQDVTKYVSYYVEQYAPGNMSHQVWLQQRKRRLSKPEWIRVELDEIQLSGQQNDSLTITLRQKYQASNYSDISHKRFILVQSPQGWLISSESSL